MEGAVDNNIPGIEAECGGMCSCATCHVYVDPAWKEATGSPNGIESDMLESALDLQENSRLSCQIEVGDELDGLVVRMPELQI
jgi:2Fe-2S ferredoxin